MNTYYLKKMNSHEDEEDEGPSVDSAVAEERIAARRIRIHRRLEAAKRFLSWAIRAIGKDFHSSVKSFPLNDFFI